jgi:hypothetical protein
MPQPGSAVLATFGVDLSREAEQRRFLDEVIVPAVRKAPGFVSGYWTLDRDAGEGIVLVTLESAVDAAGLADAMRANAPNQARVGLELVSIRIVDVVVSATHTGTTPST